MNPLTAETNNDTEVVFNCSSSGSPATNVVWSRNGELIDEDNQHQMEQILRNRQMVVYDNLLKISANLIDSGTYRCRVNNSRAQVEGSSELNIEVGKFQIVTVTMNHIQCSVLVSPLFADVIFNASTSELSWSFQMEDPLQGITYFTSLAGYEAEIEGGHCRKICNRTSVHLMPRITTTRTLGSVSYTHLTLPTNREV